MISRSVPTRKAQVSKAQVRIYKVLDNLKSYVSDSESAAEIIAEWLEESLNELLHEDFFGTEGQNDPRGDFRDGQWSMNRVQGIDK
jgi:hypothetical protein